MNFKTTIVLVVLLVLVGLVWLFFPHLTCQPQPPSPTVKTETETEKDVLEPKVSSDSITKVVVERPGKPRLVFTRAAKSEAGASPPGSQMENWQAVEPLAAPVQTYPVDNLVSAFTSLRSRKQFEVGSKDAPTDADAGLSPPAATVALTDKDGKEYKFELGGKAAMSTDTYVRVVGQKTIQIATRDLQNDLLKKEFKDYRDKKLTNLAANDAVKMEIATAGKTYVLTRGPDQAWVFDVPVKAFAVKDEVLNLTRKVGGLSAQEFIDDAPASLAEYGLDQPYMTVSITTETKKKLPAPEGESATQPAEPKYETVPSTYALLIGGFADLKQDKRYAKVAGQPWVVSVSESDVKGLVPDPLKLRDPKITRIKATDATSLEITSGGATATLRRSEAAPGAKPTWQGTGDLAELETAAIDDLLQAFEDISAIDYVDQPEAPSKYSLDQPRAVITVTTTGSVTPTTLRIGAETASGKNAYVQRGQEPTVMVTSAAQATRLAVSLLALRSREIFTFPTDDLRTVTIERAPTHYTVVRTGNEWTLREPADAPLDQTSFRLLAGDLSRLRAKQVVGKGDDARFELDKPAETIRFEVEQPASTQPTSGPSTQATTAPSTAPTTAAASQPTTAPATAPAGQNTTHLLRISHAQGTSYARKDNDPFIFELDDTVYRVLVAELIDARLFSFKLDDVVGAKIVSTGGTLEFTKEGDQWKYAADPFVKLDQKKVKDFIQDIAQFRAEAYFVYRDGDLLAAGLDKPPAALTLRMNDGREIVLNMTQERPGELPRRAALVTERRIFRMRQADCEKLMRGLDEYLVSEKPATPPETPEAPPAGQRPAFPPRTPPRPPRP